MSCLVLPRTKGNYFIHSYNFSSSSCTTPKGSRVDNVTELVTCQLWSHRNLSLNLNLVTYYIFNSHMPLFPHLWNYGNNGYLTGWSWGLWDYVLQSAEGRAAAAIILVWFSLPLMGGVFNTMGRDLGFTQLAGGWTGLLVFLAHWHVWCSVKSILCYCSSMRHPQTQCWVIKRWCGRVCPGASPI